MINNSNERISADSLFIARIADTTADILYVMDLQSMELVYCNRSIGEYLNYSSSYIESLKNPILDIMYEEDKPAMIKHLEDMRQARDGEVVEIEYRMVHKNGSLYWFRDRDTVFKRNEEGHAIEKLGIAQDITDLKKASDKILKQHMLLKNSEEMAGAGSWEYNITTHEFSWSEGMFSLFEINKIIVVHPSIYVKYAVPADVHIAKKICGHIEKKFLSFEEIVRLDINGKIKVVKVRGEPLVSKYYKQIIGISRDITAFIEAENNIRDLNNKLLQQNRKLESLNSEIKTFTTIAAINYRTPLATLYTAIELIIKQDAFNLTDSSKASLRKSQSAIQKMKLMTEDLISYFDIGLRYSNMTDVHLNTVIRSILTGLSFKIENANATVNVAELPNIKGNLNLLLLLFQYLLDNAIKFRKENIPPVIHIDYLPASSASNPEQPGDQYMGISIKDNGIGFEEKEVDKLFTIFSKLNEKGKYRGSGIGLAMCKKIMDIHGGFIKATGMPGTGAVFTCYFPVSVTRPGKKV
jgi:PAS domain S-box-containing protein